MDATTIGVDVAKTVFELALANAAWRVIGRKRLTRPEHGLTIARGARTALTTVPRLLEDAAAPIPDRLRANAPPPTRGGTCRRGESRRA